MKAKSTSGFRPPTMRAMLLPALSRSIRALEDELGQALFDRIGRHSELTPFGRATVAQARERVLAADDLRSSGRQTRAGGDEGVLRVGLGSGPGAKLMTPLLLKMARVRPRLRLDIARASTDRLVQALRERQLDALVVDTRSLRHAPDLNAHFVHEMTGAFLVRPGHPLASTPLSDEVARVLVKRYGPAAHPSACATLRRRTAPPGVDTLRELMQQCLQDGPPGKARTAAAASRA